MSKALDIIKRQVSSNQPAPRTSRNSQKNTGFGYIVIISLSIVFLALSSTKIFKEDAGQKTENPAVKGEATPENIAQTPAKTNNEAIKGQVGSLPKVDDTPKPAEVQTPTEETSPSIKKSDIKISILNGSGRAGAAADLKSELEQIGYKIESTGTAKKPSATSQLYYHEGKQDLAKLLSQDLKKYTFDQTESALAGDNDVLFIIGKK